MYYPVKLLFLGIKKNLPALFCLFFSVLSLSSVSYGAPNHKKNTVSINKKTNNNPVANNSNVENLAKFPSSIGVAGVEVQSKQAFLINAQTGTVLLERDADALMHPSSMTKIMTVILALEKIKAGVVNLDTEIVVGKDGWRTEGSSMFLNINDRVKVIDLLKGIIVHSGNDASIVLARALSGSESGFATEMTDLAKKLGANHTTFANATGLPQDGHRTTARDLATLAHHAIYDYPDYYPFYSEKSFTYGGITQENRNLLLHKNIGCDGIKTGHSSVAGYGMVASCVDPQGAARYILVINGLPSATARASEAMRLMTWVMGTFENYTLFTAGQVIGEVDVGGGVLDKIPLSVARDLTITIARMGKKELKTEFIYNTPLTAPIKKGEVVGKILVTSAYLPSPLEFPLVAALDVKKAGIFKSITNAFFAIFRGK